MATQDSYIQIHCPLCNGERYTEQYSFTKPLSYTVVRCSECSLVYMNPQITPDVLDAFYNDEKYYSGGADYTYSDERKAKSAYAILFHSRLRSIEHFVEIGNILDVGCSFGGFLECARDRGWRPYGLDVSQPVIDHVRKLGISAHQGSLSSATYETNFFSAITMVEVIEHLPDPLEDLRHCYRILRPGGVLAIQTGNIESVAAKLQGKKFGYYLPGHVVYFSPKTIRTMLRKAGFTSFTTFAGDAISFRDRQRYIRATQVEWKPRLLMTLRWSIFYLARKLVFNSPVLGSITIYAHKK